MKKAKRVAIPEELRANLLLESGFRCTIALCNREGLLVDIHHIDGNRANSVQDNLIVLCVVHHRLADRGTISPEMCKQAKEDLKQNLGDLSAFGSNGISFLEEVAFNTSGDPLAAWEGRALSEKDLDNIEPPSILPDLVERFRKERILYLSDHPGTGKTSTALFVAKEFSGQGFTTIRFNSKAYALLVEHHRLPFHKIIDDVMSPAHPRILLIDSSHLVFKGPQGVANLTFLLGRWRISAGLHLILAYTHEAGSLTISKRGKIHQPAVPSEDIAMPQSLPQEDYRKAAMRYVERHRLSKTGLQDEQVGRSSGLTVWQFMQLMRGGGSEHTLSPEIRDNMGAKVALYAVSEQHYLHNEGTNLQHLAQQVRDIFNVHLPNLFPPKDIPLITQTGISALVNQGRLVMFENGILACLHVMHAKDILRTILHEKSVIAEGLNRRFLAKVSDRIGYLDLEPILKEILGTDPNCKYSLRHTASIVGGGGFARSARSATQDNPMTAERLDLLKGYAQLLGLLSEISELASHRPALDNLIIPLLSPLNHLVRVAANTWGLYQVCSELFSGNQYGLVFNSLSPQIVGRLDTSLFSKILGAPRDAAEVMEAVICLDALRGLERIYLAESVLRWTSRMVRAWPTHESSWPKGVNAVEMSEDEQSTGKGHSLISLNPEDLKDDKIELLQVAAKGVVEAESLLTGRLRRLLPWNRRPLPLSWEEIEVRVAQVSRKLRRLAKWNRPEWAAAAIIVRKIYAMMEAPILIESLNRSFPELNISGESFVALREAVKKYGYIFRGELRMSSEAMQTITSKLDVDQVVRNLKDIPKEMPIYLRALYSSNRAKAEELLTKLDPRQRMELLNQIVQTHESEDYSPLHVRPESILTFAFTEFAASQDRQLLSWWTKRKTLLGSDILQEVSQLLSDSVPPEKYRLTNTERS